jgi:hypothetical protein
VYGARLSRRTSTIRLQLQAAPLRAARVAERGAPAAGLVGDDLVLGLDVEEGHVGAVSARAQELGADLDVAALRCLEGEIEAGARVAVGELGEGRRLKPLPKFAYRLVVGSSRKSSPATGVVAL